MKTIHLNSNGDMVNDPFSFENVCKQMDVINKALYGKSISQKVVYSANGPDDQDVSLSDAEKYEPTGEIRDEDNIPF